MWNQSVNTVGKLETKTKKKEKKQIQRYLQPLKSKEVYSYNQKMLPVSNFLCTLQLSWVACASMKTTAHFQRNLEYWSQVAKYLYFMQQLTRFTSIIYQHDTDNICWNQKGKNIGLHCLSVLLLFHYIYNLSSCFELCKLLYTSYTHTFSLKIYIEFEVNAKTKSPPSKPKSTKYKNK